MYYAVGIHGGCCWEDGDIAPTYLWHLSRLFLGSHGAFAGSCTAWSGADLRARISRTPFWPWSINILVQASLMHMLLGKDKAQCSRRSWGKGEVSEERERNGSIPRPKRHGVQSSPCVCLQLPTASGCSKSPIMDHEDERQVGLHVVCLHGLSPPRY